MTIEGDGPNGIEIKGKGNLSGNTITLAATPSAQTLDASKVNVFDPFKITWTLTINGAQVSAGASSNKLWATLSASNATPLYETLLLLGGQGANGSMSPDSTVSGIWTDFQHPSSGVMRADGTVMTYWRGNTATSFCQTLAGMLAPQTNPANNGNGTCIAWSSLLDNAILAQGITGSPSVPGGQLKILQITTPNTPAAPSSGFLVKNWNFGKHIRTGPNGIRQSDRAGDDEEVFPKGQGMPNVPCVAPAAGQSLASTPAGDDLVIAGKITTGPDGICNTTATGTDSQLIPVGNGAPNAVAIGPGPDGILNSVVKGSDVALDGVFSPPYTILQGYPYLQDFDARDQPGIAGQDNANPPGGFFNHFVVSYGGQIYDPSYGAGPYATTLLHENSAIDGIFCNFMNGACLDQNNQNSNAVPLARKKAVTQELLYQ